MIRDILLDIVGVACVFVGIPVVVMFYGVALGLN